MLVFDPPLAGKGEWLNTSLYRFVPDEGAIEPNTTYDVTVPAALTNQPDGVLASDYSGASRPTAPPWCSVTPGRDTQYVGLDQDVEMEFNQPMDRASVEAGFTLTDPCGPATAIAGSFSWSSDSTQVTFTPRVASTMTRAIAPSSLPASRAPTVASRRARSRSTSRPWASRA